MKGYFAGDGCYHSHETKKKTEHLINFVSVSKNLISSIQDLLLTEGIISRCSIAGKEKISEIEGRKVYCKEKYQLFLSTNETRKFFDLIGRPHAIPKSRINSRGKIENNKLYVPIQFLESKEVSHLPVFNLTVKKNNTYCMRMMTTHNCDFAVGTGTTADYSVFTVVENIGRKTYIRRIERYKGMPIAFQKERIKELHKIFKCKHIYLDATSMGESFVQELRQEGLPITPCDFSYKNRNDYLMNLRRYIDEKRLVIPRNFEDPMCITMGDILYKELISFVVTKTPSGMVTYKSTAKHDDCVFSLALAIKGASAQIKFIDTFFAE